MAFLAAFYGWQEALVIAGVLGLAVAVLVVLTGPFLRDDASAAREKKGAAAERPSWRFMLSPNGQHNVPAKAVARP